MMNESSQIAKGKIRTILDALRKFIRPPISGNAIYKSFVFAETTDLLDRLVLVESADAQLTVIHIAAALAKHHPSTEERVRHSRYCSAHWV